MWSLLNTRYPLPCKSRSGFQKAGGRSPPTWSSVLKTTISTENTCLPIWAVVLWRGRSQDEAGALPFPLHIYLIADPKLPDCIINHKSILSFPAGWETTPLPLPCRSYLGDPCLCHPQCNGLQLGPAGKATWKLRVGRKAATFLWGGASWQRRDV